MNHASFPPPPPSSTLSRDSADIAVILPAYNEKLTIADTIRGFHAALPGARIFVVDNNSSDGTGQLARQTLQELGAVGEVLFEGRQGKGNAVRRAFLEVDADIYLMADADSTYPPEQAWDLLDPIIQGRADMVIGDRHSGGDYRREHPRPLHTFGNHLVQRLVNLVGKSSFVDIMSGYRAMSRSFVRSYPLLVEGFQIETDLSLFAALGRFRCMEVPVRYVDRPTGSFSKLNTLQDGIRVLLTIFRITRYCKPLFFFTALSVLTGLLGMLLGIPVLLEYLRYSYIYKIPSAILATGLEGLAVTLFGVGLVLDALAYQRHIHTENGIRAATEARFPRRRPGKRGD